jgi:septum formation topological specificity factor MinE
MEDRKESAEMMSNELFKIRIIVFNKRVNCVVEVVSCLKHEIIHMVRHWVSLRPEFVNVFTIPT